MKQADSGVTSGESVAGTRCVICGAPLPSVAEATHRSRLDGEVYSLFGCRRCASQYWTPLEMKPEFYAEEVFNSYIDHHQGASPLQPWHRPFFESLPPRGRLLDVGCGSGAFLNAARAHGFEPWGIDLDRKSVSQARANRGLKDVHAMGLDAFVEYIRDQDIKFDVISFFEVLEHQTSPRDFVSGVRSLLRPGGRIVGSVPNRERIGPSFDRGGPSRDGDLPPHHFFWFSEPSLRFLFECEGFTDIRISRSKLTLREVGAWTEAFLLGSVSERAKGYLKTVMVGPEARHASVGNLPGAAEARGSSALLTSMRVARDVAFLPLAWAIRSSYNGRGAQLYFDAKPG